jgi:NAD+ synthase
MAKPLLAIDAEKEEKRITAFIRRVVRKSGANGVVVGLSGGVDSSVVLALCVRVLGRENVLAALLPSKHTPPGDTEDAVRLADEWGVRRISVAISPLVDSLISAVGSGAEKLARANVQARVRMTILYYLANLQGLLVVGTGDRSEELLGFFTKFGDGGADFLPIAHLYKTQVRLMGRHLSIPPSIVNKPASPQLWPGHTAREELPAGYEKLDIVMHCLFDEGGSVPQAATEGGASRAVAHRVLEMHRKSAHKRAIPPSLRPKSG